MAAALTQEQEQATKNFIDVVNRLRRRRSAGPVSWATAVKFLAARKFDVGRAVALYEQHEATRQREGLVRFDPSREPLKSELDTGKFTILPTRDGTGAAIAVFTARMHCPQVSSHQTTLQGVVYQLDVALESVDTQKSGLVFIYDMSDSKYSNFDYDLSQKILTLLKEQRSWIKIECARGRTSRQCHQGLQEACGKSALPYRTVARCVKPFNDGRQTVADIHQTGHPTSVSEEVPRYWTVIETRRFVSIRFRTVAEIRQAVDCSIRTNNRTGSAIDMLRLPHRWQRVIHNAGDYSEGQ
ncbi:tyrosine-protein phosphatase non-receptor type 9-like [Anabrus simplex]|uniref:tyrosine-protein phosphatase non-receptor type 9-like n=1 Tax=Anabrus simplex TaxID=316456 RepID=UPI0035A3B74D